MELEDKKVQTKVCSHCHQEKHKVMKANEAPEKIYLPFENEDDVESLELYSEKCSDKEIEYTRTDAFIEKACAWLENNLQGIVGGSIYIEDFRKYMKGE